MTIIQSGADTTPLTVNPENFAARVAPYDQDGNPLHPALAGSYATPIEVIPSTVTNNTTYWALTNNGALTLFLKRMFLTLGFSGTVAASRTLYSIMRFGSAVPTGGTNLTPVPKRSTMNPSSISDNRFAPGGLTTTSLVFETPATIIGITNQFAASVEYDLDWLDKPFELLPNEGLAIRAYGGGVAGAYATGYLEWDEK